MSSFGHPRPSLIWLAISCSNTRELISTGSRVPAEALGRENRPAVQHLAVISRVGLDERDDVGIGEPARRHQPAGVGSDTPDDDRTPGVHDRVDRRAQPRLVRRRTVPGSARARGRCRRRSGERRLCGTVATPIHRRDVRHHRSEALLAMVLLEEHRLEPVAEHGSCSDEIGEKKLMCSVLKSW